MNTLRDDFRSLAAASADRVWAPTPRSEDSAPHRTDTRTARMTSYARLVDDALQRFVVPALSAIGFARSGRRAWTQGHLQIRAVVDSKASDPYRGGAFTLEFEVSNDGRFEEKLDGRVRIHQLLDDSQREAFLRVRNSIARRLEQPPPEHLQAIPAATHEEYLRPCSQATELEKRFWMRFRTPEDLADWCGVIVSELPGLVERARSLPANELLLGRSLRDMP